MRYGLPNEVARVGGHYEFIFADPPHEMADYETLVKAIGEADLLAAAGQLVIEHHSKTPVPDTTGGLTLQRKRSYGKTTLSFYA